MSSCLDDPRAQALLSSSSTEVEALATQFSTVATAAQDAVDGLHGAHGDVQWTGAAADGFRTQLGKLPDDLGKVHDSYSQAAQALRSYAGELEPIQRAFRALVPQLQAAQTDLTNAHGALTTANTKLTTATGTKGADTSTATTAVSTAQGQVGRLTGELSGLEGRGQRLLDEFDHDRGRAVDAVDRARDVAPVHHSSFLGGIAHVLSSAGHFLGDVGKGIATSFKNVFTGKDFIEFFKHPSWTTFGQLAKDVGTVAGTLAAVAAPFAAPELLAADGAAEAGEVGAEGAAETAGELAGGGAGGGGDAATETASTFTKGATRLYNGADKLSTASTRYQEFDDVRRGDVKGLVTDKALDHTYLKGDRVVDKLKVGEGAAKDAEHTLDQMKVYGKLRSHGVPDSIAKRYSFGDRVPASLAHHDPTAGDLDGAVRGQVGAVNDARRRALHIGKPVSSGIDDLTDPVKEKIKDRVAPEPEPAGAGG